MFNKIYDKTIQYIKEEYKFIIILALILFFGLFRLPYNLYIGGGIIDIAKRLEVENGEKIDGSYNMAYVITTRATIPTYLLSYVFDWERESINDTKLDENDNVSDMWKREKLYLKEANDNAIISAYQLAMEDININSEVLEVLYVDKDSETDLEIGDIILSINNIKIKAFEEIKEILKDFEIGDKVSVTYLRDNQEMEGFFKVREMNGEKKAGLYLIKLFDYDIKRKVNIEFSNKEGGPSGGFMLSLAIYDQLTDTNLAKGRKIVGTGTIDKDGNVGEIGGVKYKLIGAYRNDADIFFVPEENYEEALKVKKDKNYEIEIVKVKTLQEAVNYLGGK